MRENASSDDAGDPVCWLSQVCPECGLLIEAPLPAVCERCGAQVPPDEDSETM